MKTNELRQKFLEFFKEREHEIVPSASLLPENDPTTLFTGSGMQPMVPYLLGEKHPKGVRLADSQKCFRAQDIEEVGDNRHTTFFEMLGNWSLGDYFKKEQISWMFEFLTKELKLDPKNIYITCFKGNEALQIERDEESVKLWQEEFKKLGIEATVGENPEADGMQDNKIFYYDDKKNWWSRSGVPAKMPEGEPGGPDSEMFWDYGVELGLHEKSEWKDEPCHVNCDCGRFMEIGNNVFMEYQKVQKKILFVDAMYTLFDENWQPVVEVVEAVKNISTKYDLKVFVITNGPKEIVSQSISNTDLNATIITYENSPSKNNPSYFAKVLDEYNLNSLDILYIDHSQDNLASANQHNISGVHFKGVDSLSIVDTKLSAFQKLEQQNVDEGSGLERMVAATINNPDVFMIDAFDNGRSVLEELSGKKYGESEEVTEAFRVILDHLRAATFLISDSAYPSNKDQGYFTRRLIRRSVRFAASLGIEENFCGRVAEGFIETYQEAYPNLGEEKKSILDNMSKEEEKFRKALKRGAKEYDKKIDEIKKSASQENYGELAKIAFDLYQTHGLPVEVFTDYLNNIGVAVEEMKMLDEFDKVVKEHQAVSRAGAEKKFHGGLADHSEKSVRGHTATHLLHAALREVLGEHVQQKGSNITPERVRFDFSHSDKLTDEEVKKVEDLVNAAIEKDYPVSWHEMTVDEAYQKKAIGFFPERYDEIVKVYTIGDPEKPMKADPESATFSQEICGGPHVEHTSVVGKFKIAKEEALGTGLRRIKALLE